MTRSLPSSRALLRQGLRSAFRRPWATFGLVPLTVAVTVGGSLMPWLNFPFLLVALAPTLGSLPMIGLAAVRDEPLPSWAPFIGFTRYERYLALFWVPYLVAIGAAAPFLVGFWVDLRITHGDGRLWVLGLPALVSLGLLFTVLHRYVFAPIAAADLDRDLAFQDLLDRSAARLEGRRRAVFQRLFVLGAFGLGGGLLYAPLLFITAPIALLASVHLYLALDETAAPQAPSDAQYASSSSMAVTRFR